MAPTSPNQQDKQRMIVDAAKVVLVRDGLSGTTARSIADASPLTKSAIHYYFDDVDEIIDLAMAEHISAFVTQVASAADAHRTPSTRFWAAVEEYLGVFLQQPTVALLWFDYWVDSVQKGRSAAVDAMHEQVTDLLAGLLDDMDVRRPATVAHALLSYLLGTVIQQAVRPVPFSTVRREVASLCGV